MSQRGCARAHGPLRLLVEAGERVSGDMAVGDTLWSGNGWLEIACRVLGTVEVDEAAGATDGEDAPAAA